MVRDTILILEDDEQSRKRLEEILRGKYKIQAVTNEREGVEILRKQTAILAAVLVNIMIPARDGFKVMEWLSEKKFLSRIPFIMLTTDMTVELEKKGYECGAVGSVKKPFYPEVVKQLVENMIGVFQI